MFQMWGLGASEPLGWERGLGAGDCWRKRLTGLVPWGFLRALPGGYWEPLPRRGNRPEEGVPPSRLSGEQGLGLQGFSKSTSNLLCCLRLAV